MRIIFLDVDGVLNCQSTKERYQGFIGVDPVLTENLARLVSESEKEEETKIVLSSSWRIGQDFHGEQIPGHYRYLTGSLAEHGLQIYDNTPYITWGDDGGRGHRGREISAWLYQHRMEGISGYLVLDDELFGDFKKYGITKHLVRTSMYDPRGGFREKHIRYALEILKKDVTLSNGDLETES